MAADRAGQVGGARGKGCSSLNTVEKKLFSLVSIPGPSGIGKNSGISGFDPDGRVLGKLFL